MPPESLKKKEEESFVENMKEIRRRARQKMDEGNLTMNYPGDLSAVSEMLNEALATEIMCVLRYRSHFYATEGIYAQSISDTFWEHAQEEQDHADRIARRIRELGGRPNFNPDGLKFRSLAEYVDGSTLIEMIHIDLIAERVVVDAYREMIRFVAEFDPTTRRLLEKILKKEEEHADVLNDLRQSMDPTLTLSRVAS